MSCESSLWSVEALFFVFFQGKKQTFSLFDLKLDEYIWKIYPAEKKWAKEEEEEDMKMVKNID